jgi:hypothetical protein
LTISVKTDNNPAMSDAALATNIVSLDDYRRSRGGDRKSVPARSMSALAAIPAIPAMPAAPAVWVYWVPVWVW